MKIREYTFYEAEPFLKFIEENIDKLAGKEIKRVYTDGVFGSITDTPVAFEFEDVCIVVEYFFYSDIKLTVTDPKTFYEDESFEYVRGARSVDTEASDWDKDMLFPYIGRSVKDAALERFSEEFEINGATGETRPDGGDYFKTIAVFFDNGMQFFICGQDAMDDGYMRLWDYDS